MERYVPIDKSLFYKHTWNESATDIDFGSVTESGISPHENLEKLSLVPSACMVFVRSGKGET